MQAIQNRAECLHKLQTKTATTEIFYAQYSMIISITIRHH